MGIRGRAFVTYTVAIFLAGLVLGQAVNTFAGAEIAAAIIAGFLLFPAVIIAAVFGTAFYMGWED